MKKIIQRTYSSMVAFLVRSFPICKSANDIFLGNKLSLSSCIAKTNGLLLGFKNRKGVITAQNTY